MKNKLLIIVVFGILFYSCSPKVVPQFTPPKEPTSEIVNSQISVENVVLTAELAEGKSLFENNCAKCHDLNKPKDFNSEQWKPILVRMQKQADISDIEREKIYNYLTMN